jgi:enamine deaminase RidA (YjgF/YER057c/UK114 family)
VLASSLPVHWPDELLELAGDVSAGVEQEARHARAWRDDQWQLLQEVQHPCDRAEYDWALDVVQTRNYVRDAANLPLYNQLYREYFPAPSPARTTITDCLPPDLKYEVEAVAVRRP